MRNLLYILIVIFSFSCNYLANQQTNAQLYDKDGLSFELPKYWDVEKDRAISGVANSRLITVSNNEPFLKDSYFVITAVDRKKSLAFTLENLIEQSRASFAKRKMSFGLLYQPKQIVFGEHQALRIGFETKMLTIRHQGCLTVFDHNGKTYSVINSAKSKDSKQNMAVVDEVIKSLKAN